MISLTARSEPWTVTSLAIRSACVAVLASLVLVPGAAANIPPAVTKTSPVRLPAQNNAANGTLTTKVSYTATTATAAASTGNTIGLAHGFLYRLRTCVAYHRHGVAPQSNCAERTVDARTNSATVYTYAPSVTLARQPRQTTEPWAYFKAYTEVLKPAGAGWSVHAHSWPDDGLQGAGIPIAAQGAAGAALPPSSTVTFETPFTGAVNSGQPDSFCTAAPAAGVGGALPAGVTATHPAFKSAPAAYEVGLPTGSFADRAPLGVMLVIHGGGWTATGTGSVHAMRADADRWRARGWETVNLSYRACAQSAADVLWFFDKTRAWFGAGAKICTLGTSAGAHLGLLIGVQRDGLYCAVTQAGPTNLTTIHRQAAYDSATGAHTQTVGGRFVHNLGAAALGSENLASQSPAARANASLAATRVLQGFSADDAWVPYEQATELASALRAVAPGAYVDSVQLAAGPIPFGHGAITQAAYDDFRAREAQLVAAITTPTVPLDRR